MDGFSLRDPGHATLTSLSTQAHWQPVWVKNAYRAARLTSTLLYPFLLALGPILALSVERGFHSSIRWRRITESTQVWTVCICLFFFSSHRWSAISSLSPLLDIPLAWPTFAHFFLLWLSPPVGEKPFSCSLCPQRSRDFSAMTKHLRTHGAAPYRCPLCRVGCPSLASMQAHMRGHSPSQLPPGWTIRSTFLYSSSRPSRTSISPGSPTSSGT